MRARPSLPLLPALTGVLFATTLLVSAAASAQSGTGALIYCGDRGYCSAGVTRLEDNLRLTGATLVESTESLPADLTPYRIVVLVAPNDTMSVSGLERLTTFYEAGGYLIMAADNAFFAPRSVTNMNDLATRIGIDARFVADEIDCGSCGAFTVEVLDHPLTEDVESVSVACASRVTGGTALLREGADALAAVEERALLLADGNLLNAACPDHAANDALQQNFWAWANVNEGPTAENDFYVGDEDVPLNFNLLDNDTDPNGDTLTAELVTEPTHGAVVVAEDGRFEYVGDPNYNGPDEFTYAAIDRLGERDEGLVTITLRPVNDPPSATDDLWSGEEDVAISENVLENDTDVDGDDLTASVVEEPEVGTLTLEDDGSFTWEPPADYSGVVTFTYAAEDEGGLTDEAEVTLVIGGTNDPPVAVAADLETREDTPLDITLEASDPEDDPLFFAIVTEPRRGSLEDFVLADGTLTYAPNRDFAGVDFFEFTVSDGVFTTPPTRVDITVTPVNDPPMITDGLIVTPEETDAAFAISATDVDSDLTYAFTDPTRGSVVAFDPATGRGTYRPPMDYSGNDSFGISATDGEVTVRAVVRVRIGAENDAPTVDDLILNTPEDRSLSVRLAGTDPDGDPISFRITSGPESGTVDAFDADEGTFTYVPEPDWFGTVRIRYVATDGALESDEGLVTINVLRANDSPVAEDLFVTVPEDGSVEVELVATDVDSPSLSYLIRVNPGNGSIEDFDSSEGTFTYVPFPEYSGADTIVYQAFDGTTTSDEATVFITVENENDPPRFVAPTPTGVVIAFEAAEVTFEVAAVDDDGPGDVTVTLPDLPTGATFDGGRFAWTPDWRDSGLVTLEFEASDTIETAIGEVAVDVRFVDEDEDGVPDSAEEENVLDTSSDDTDGDTISDFDEIGDPADPTNTDGDDLIDALDEDSDGDGVLDREEAGDDDTDTPPVDTDEDGIPDFQDTDSDNDGVDDRDDNCRIVDNPDQGDLDDDGIGDACDPDMDRDGVPDDIERERGLDPTTDDSDGDTISDADELGRDFARIDSDGDGTPDALDEDSDDDGVLDRDEAGDDDVGTPPVDTDGDGIPDVRDGDSDDDEVDDEDDNCRLVANPDQTDTNDDGVGDACDGDNDGDGIDDEDDNCPDVANEDQVDTDDDGAGDACDDLNDADGDEVDDAFDNCPDVANEDQIDTDLDGLGDACDDTTDSDGDGLEDADDNCPDVSNEDQTDSDGDGVGDACDEDTVDDDGDTIDDVADNCPDVFNPDQADTDGDGIGDACDSTPEGGSPGGGGCDCSVPGSGLPTGSGVLWAMVGLGLVVRRRRR